ncbi:hypothetical protein Hanom_Chr03g00197071 [Helianthus anomalus]
MLIFALNFFTFLIAKMASKTGESSSAQTSSDALHCKWGSISFNNLVQEVSQSPSLRICLHSPRSYPRNYVFRVFFVLVWKSSFLNFDRRDIGVSCLRDIPASSRDKEWKKKFFYIDASVIPRETHWREMGPKDKFKDEESMVIQEGDLVMAGMSLLWRNSRLYPAFQRLDEGKWSLFDFVHPPRNAALISADRVIGEQEPKVLRIHLEQFLLHGPKCLHFAASRQRWERCFYCRNKETNPCKDNQ